MKVDPQTLATGYRTSKVVSSNVVNEANETVGTINDLIVTPGEKVPFAVLRRLNPRSKLPTPSASRGNWWSSRNCCAIGWRNP
jgi:hypothetical protein